MSTNRRKIHEAIDLYYIIAGDESFKKLDPRLKNVVLEKTADYAEKLILILIGDQKIKIPRHRHAYFTKT